jgi:hypothetical protein
MLFLKHSWPGDVIQGQFRDGYGQIQKGTERDSQVEHAESRIPGTTSKHPKAIGKQV